MPSAKKGIAPTLLVTQFLDANRFKPPTLQAPFAANMRPIILLGRRSGAIAMSEPDKRLQ